jgi:hypothetical protein
VCVCRQRCGPCCSVDCPYIYIYIYTPAITRKLKQVLELRCKQNESSTWFIIGGITVWCHATYFLSVQGIPAPRHHHHHDSPLWAIAFLGFTANRIFTGWGSEPHAQSLNLKDDTSAFVTPGYIMSQLYPKHWVHILVAFYELRWDYSYPPVTTQRHSSTYVN